MQFPYTRLRRNRKSAWSREMVSEVTLSPSDLIYPMFVIEGKNKSEDIVTMPGIERLSIDLAAKKAKEAKDLGIPMIALFPSIDPDLKDDEASEAIKENNLVCRAIKEIKKQAPEIGIMVDVALDPYTSHGHDGIVRSDDVDNDETLDMLCKQALLLARAGADVIAPSDMMDGRIGEIRNCLEEEGMTNVQIISYAVKYASNFYGPFRDAVRSKSNLGKADKKSYQMDFRNSDEALLEVELDLKEGADMVIVKPGMPYLDIMRRVKDTFGVPVIAYQVSGEYSMLKVAAANDIFDGQQTMFESLLAFKRAGCCAIVTYGAIEIAKDLNKKAA